MNTIQDQTSETTKHAVKLLPSFSSSCDIGEVFTKWLTGSGGGCKKDRAAQQIVTRCFKFLRFCCEDEEELTFDVVDFSLCSPNSLFKFIDYLQDECKLGHGGRLGYIDAISEMIDVRPLLKPQCHFVLVNRNGGQHGKLGEIMSKLVFDAIGKYIHPTRYRQIVETQSLNELTSEEQRILSEDQKHSSAVAKVHYQKQRSREVALKGHKCLQKLQGAKGSEVDEDVHARLGDSTSDAGPSVEPVQNVNSSPKKDALPKRILRSHRNIRHV